MQKALEPWAQLAGHPREVLNHSPLALVICQVVFNEKLKVNDPAVAGSFQDRIDDQYPRFEQSENQQVEVSGGIGRQPEARTTQSRPVYKFSDPKGVWIVSLTSNSITLECRHYSDFGEFLQRLREIVQVCIETIRPTIAHRIGLRYINEIRLDSALDARKVIRQELLGPLAISPFPEMVITSAHLMEMKTDTDARMNITHGYFPSGTTVQLRSDESPSEKGFYLLDLDVYRQWESTDQVAMNADRIADNVLAFHDTSSKVFWWSVTDEFLTQAKGS